MSDEQTTPATDDAPAATPASEPTPAPAPLPTRFGFVTIENVEPTEGESAAVRGIASIDVDEISSVRPVAGGSQRIQTRPANGVGRLEWRTFYTQPHLVIVTKTGERFNVEDSPEQRLILGL